MSLQLYQAGAAADSNLESTDKNSKASTFSHFYSLGVAAVAILVLFYKLLTHWYPNFVRYLINCFLSFERNSSTLTANPVNRQTNKQQTELIT